MDSKSPRLKAPAGTKFRCGYLVCEAVCPCAVIEAKNISDTMAREIKLKRETEFECGMSYSFEVGQVARACLAVQECVLVACKATLAGCSTFRVVCSFSRYRKNAVVRGRLDAGGIDFELQNFNVIFQAYECSGNELAVELLPISQSDFDIQQTTTSLNLIPNDFR